MKTVLSLTLLTAFGVLTAASAFAQDRIELYADVNRTSCAISEPLSPPIVQVHVFLVGPTDATGVRFKAPKPDCWVGATYLGDLLPTNYGMIGNSQTDWSVAFGRCVSATAGAYVGAISYLISNQAQACCEVTAVPAGQFVFTDCSDRFAEHPLEATKTIVINANETCGCQSGVLTATLPSTWGQVKALYR